MIRKTKWVTVDLKTIEEWRPLSIYAARQGKSLRGLVREMLAPRIQEICKQIQIPEPSKVKPSDKA